MRALFVLAGFAMGVAGLLTPVLNQPHTAAAVPGFDGPVAWIDFDGDLIGSPGVNALAPYGDTGLVGAGRERGLAGVSIELLDAGTTIATTITAADGTYGFTVADGTYEVMATAPIGYAFASATPAGDHDLTADPAPEPGSRQTARAAVTVIDGDAEWPTIALTPLADLSVAHTDTDPNLEGVQLIQTGLAPFDTTGSCPADPPAAGDDCGSSDLYLRTNDLATMTVSVVADDIDTDMALLDDVLLEQQIVPAAGAAVDYAFDPALGVAVACLVGGVTVDSQVLPRAGGGWTMLCNLGQFDRAELKVVTSTITALGTSAHGSTFSVISRAYTAADDAMPSAPISTGAVTISASPMLDLTIGESSVARNQVFEQDAVTNKINPATGQDEIGKVFYYDVSITAGGAGKGTTAVSDPMTFTFELDDTYEGAVLHECHAGPFDNAGTSPLPANGAGTIQANAVADAGIWTCTHDVATNTVTVTVTGADTTGGHYPTRAISGQELGESYYVATGSVRVWYPMSSFYKTVDPSWDAAQPAIDGNYPITVCVSDFAPLAVSTLDPNFRGAGEPDYGESDGDPAPLGENCRTHSIVVSTSAVVFGTRFGHGDLLNSGPSVELWPCNGRLVAGQSGCDSGDGAILPNDRTVIELEGKNRSGVERITDQILCAAIDNSLAFVDPVPTGPLAGAYATAQFFSPDIPGGFAPADMADWTIEYATFTPAAGQSTWRVDHEFGPADPVTGFVPADVSPMLNATDDCGDSLAAAGTLQFSETVTDPGAVVMVRLRPRTPAGVLEVGQDINLYVSLRTRSTVHGDGGQPQAGAPIQTGWLLPTIGNYGRFGAYVDHDYDPITHTGGHVGSVSHGDRLVFDQLRLDLDLKASTLTAAPGADDAEAIIAGDSVMWTVEPAITSRAEGTASGVEIAVELPDALFYDPLCSPDLPPGIGGPLVDTVGGKTVLIFDLGTRHSTGELPAVDFCTGSNPFAIGEEAAVQAVIQSIDVTAPEESRSAERAARLLATGGVVVFKEADATVDTPGEPHQWLLHWGNTSEHLVVDGLDVIDVLPWNGDGDGSLSERSRLTSGFGGSLHLAALPAAPVRSVAGGAPTVENGTWFFSADDPATIDYRPQAASNQPGGVTTWCEFTNFGTGGCPAGLPAVSAVRFVSADPLAPQAVVTAILDIDTIDGPRPAGLDAATSRAVYVNRFAAHSATFDSQDIRSNEAWVQVMAFSLGDLLFTDRDEDGTYDPAVDQPGPAGVTIELYDATDTRVAVTTTDDDGRWRFDGLTGGDYYVRIPHREFTSSLRGWRAAGGAAADPNNDGDEGHDHHATEDADHPGDVRSAGLIRLSASLASDGATLQGMEPLGDRHGAAGRLERDDLSNFTLDLALVAPTGLRVDTTVCVDHLTAVCDPDDIAAWAETTAIRPGADAVLRVEIENTGALDLDGVWLDSAEAGGCTATGSGAALPPAAPANPGASPARAVPALSTLAPGGVVVFTCAMTDLAAAATPTIIAGTTLATNAVLTAEDAASITLTAAPECTAAEHGTPIEFASWSTSTAAGITDPRAVASAPAPAIDPSAGSATFSGAAASGVPAGSAITEIDMPVSGSSVLVSVTVDGRPHVLGTGNSGAPIPIGSGVALAPGQPFDLTVHLDPYDPATLVGVRLLGGFCGSDPTDPVLVVQTAANPVDASNPTEIEDADLAPGRLVSGTHVRWTTQVSLVGYVPVYDIIVNDELGSVSPIVVPATGRNVGDADGDGALDPAETWHFARTEALGSDAIGRTTTATATAMSETITATDTTHVTPAIVPALESWLAVNPAVESSPTGYELGGLAPGRVVRGTEPLWWVMGLTATTGDDLDPTVSHDGGTPEEPSDDFTPVVLTVDGSETGDIVGDLDGDRLLDAGETFLFTTPSDAVGPADLDPTTWLATFSAATAGPATIGPDGGAVGPATVTTTAAARHIPVDPAITLHSYHCSAGIDAVGTPESCQQVEPVDPPPPPDPPGPACFSGLYQIVDGRLRRYDPLTDELEHITPDDVATIDGLNGMGFSQPLGGFYGIVNRETHYPKRTIIRINVDGTTEALGIPAGLERSSFSGDIDPSTGTDLWIQHGNKGDFSVIDLLTFSATEVNFAKANPEVDTATSADMVWADGRIYATSKKGELNVFDPEKMTRWTVPVADLPTGTYGAMWKTTEQTIYVFRNQNGAVFRIDGYDGPSPRATRVGSMPKTSSNDGSACVEAPSPFGDIDRYLAAQAENADPSTIHVITNTGRTPLGDLLLVDDAGTPDDPSDDRIITGGPDGGDDGDMVLEPGEAWRFIVDGAIAGDLRVEAALSAVDDQGVAALDETTARITVTAATTIDAAAPAAAVNGPVAGANSTPIPVTGGTPEPPQSGDSPIPVPAGIAVAGGLLAAATAAVALGTGVVGGGAAVAGTAAAAAATGAAATGSAAAAGAGAAGATAASAASGSGGVAGAGGLLTGG